MCCFSIFGRLLRGGLQLFVCRYLALALRPIVEQGDTVAILRIQVLALAGLGEALCESGQRGEGLTRLRPAEAKRHQWVSRASTTREVLIWPSISSAGG